MTKIKGLIFDNYRVMALPPSPQTLSVIQEREKIAAQLSISLLELNQIIGWGKESQEAFLGQKTTVELWQSLFQKNNDRLLTVEEALEIGYHYWWGREKILFNEPLIDFILTNRNHYQFALLSDAWDNIFMDWSFSPQPIEKLFDQQFISCKLGLRKPHREIFDYALQNMSLLPEEIIFTDDLLENITTAQSLGIQTILYQNYSQWSEEIQKKIN